MTKQQKMKQQNVGQDCNILLHVLGSEIQKAKISTGMYTIYHQGGIMAGYSTDVRSIAAIRFMAILSPFPYCSRITGGCQLSSAVISGT